MNIMLKSFIYLKKISIKKMITRYNEEKIRDKMKNKIIKVKFLVKYY